MEVTLHATTVSRTVKLLKRRSELQKLIIYTFTVWIVYERLCFYAHEASGRECHLILLVASRSGCLHLELCCVPRFPFYGCPPSFLRSASLSLAVWRRATLGRADGDIQSTRYQSSSIIFIGHKIQRILYNHFFWNPGEFVISVHLMQT